MDASPRESAGEVPPISPDNVALDALDQFQYPSESLPKLHQQPWWIWTGVTLVLTSSVSLWAIAQLLGLPDLPNCWMVSPRSQPSVRLYCAEVFADRGTVDLLGRAIELASELPDPALSPRGDKLALQWTDSMLRLAESKFQQGNLEEALKIANKIPTTPQIRSQVNQKTSEWKAIWAKAEEIYSDTLVAIDDRNWYDTINTARQLFLVGNEFWASSKYQELMEKMRIAKEENRWRQNLASPSPLPSSSVNDLMARWEKEQEQLNRNHLQTARTLAQSGRPQDLAAAIDQAESVLYGSTQYEEAQRLVDSWQNRMEVMEDRPRLDRAIELANQGDEASLQAAISEARQIYWGRALYNEANSHIEAWTDQLYQSRVETEVEQLQELQATPLPSQPPPVFIPQPVLEPRALPILPTPPATPPSPSDPPL